jgi:hypothetical protein
MKAKSHRKVKRTHAKTILRLPDLDIAKAAVIKSLSCPAEILWTEGYIGLSILPDPGHEI